MTSPRYKEKELRIMRALLGLLSSGANIGDIKTSDIADAAGIGKGTLYNYFTTKEEIISRTIIYSIETELGEMFRRMTRVPDFRGKCYAVLEGAREIISNENSDFHLMLFHMGGKEMRQFFGGDISFIRKYLTIIFDETMRLARPGAREGLILPPDDAEYVYSAFAAALMSFVHARCRMDAPHRRGGQDGDGQRLQAAFEGAELTRLCLSFTINESETSKGLVKKWQIRNIRISNPSPGKSCLS